MLSDTTRGSHKSTIPTIGSWSRGRFKIRQMFCVSNKTDTLCVADPSAKGSKLTASDIRDCRGSEPPSAPGSWHRWRGHVRVHQPRKPDQFRNNDPPDFPCQSRKSSAGFGSRKKRKRKKKTEKRDGVSSLTVPTQTR